MKNLPATDRFYVCRRTEDAGGAVSAVPYWAFYYEPQKRALSLWIYAEEGVVQITEVDGAFDFYAAGQKIYSIDMGKRFFSEAEITRILKAREAEASAA